jgi:adenylate cyclase
MRRFLSLLLAAIVAGLLIGLRIYDPAPVASMRASGFDMLQQLWPRPNLQQPVRVVDIDEDSLRQLGQWPWPRDRLAALINNINALGPASIALDILFPETDRLSPSAFLERPEVSKLVTPVAGATLPDNDQIFASAIKQAPVVVAASMVANGPPAAALPSKAGFAQTGLDAKGAPPLAPYLLSNLQPLDDAASGIGLINIDLAENGGIARTLPLVWSDGQNFHPGLSLEALRVAQGQDTYVINGSEQLANAINSIRVGAIEIPTSEDGLMQVYYRHTDPAMMISAAQLLQPDKLEALRDRIAGHIVLIGTSATGLLDTRVSSLGESIPGVTVHAQALEQILSGQFLTRPQWAESAEILFIAISALIFSILALHLRPVDMIGSFILMLVFAIGVVAYAFKTKGIMVDATFPILAAILTFLASLAFKLLVADRQGRMLRSAFGRYVAGSVLTEIERNPGALKLGGEMRDITVMFVDIRNFTPLTQTLPPADLVHVVNTVLSHCTDAVLSESGTLDKYVGDGLMAFWNAPVTVAEHQRRAAVAAIKIQAEIRALNEKQDFAAILRPRGLWPVGVRVGLSSGPATVGNMGSLERFDYSALGETVNAGARAEAACKHVDTDILIAGEILGATAQLAVLPAGKLALKGISGRVMCHAVFGLERDATFLATAEALAAFQAGKHSASAAPTHSAYARFLAQLELRREDFV